MRAYKTQVKQAGGPASSSRAEGPRTVAQRVLALQRSAGNAVVARAVEEELHEHGTGCGHERPDAEQPVTDHSSVQASSVLNAVRSPGRPLDSRLLERAEQGYGMSFRHVRVHSDPVAQRSAAALGARAYTTGSDIVVGPQGTDDETMFHELDHVRQQSLGSVAGTDNGAGVKLSHQDDPFERSASANGRRMAQGSLPDLSGPGSGGPAQTAAPAQTGGGIAVARAPGGEGRKMYPGDRNQLFEILGEGDPIIGKYVGASSDGRKHIFDTTTHGRIRVRSSQIGPVRASVGGLHPPGQVRPPEENLRGRDQIRLSEADLSGVRARVRQRPEDADRYAATTYEDQPQYQQYETNREDLRRMGVPVINNVDVRQPETAGLFRNVAPNANLHLQMPRTGREKGYSTKRLVRDTNKLPQLAGRADVTTSHTVPHPTMYKKPGTHNGFYGVENGTAVPEGVRLVGAYSDDDADQEEYGYGHRQSGKDEGAAVSARRKTYRFASDRRSNSPEDDAPRSHRSRSKSRSRVAETPAPTRRRRSSRPPVSRTGRPPAPAPVNYAAVDDEDDYPVTSQMSRSRSRSRRPAFSYETGGPSQPAPERERGRRRESSQAPSRRSSSRPVDMGDGFSYGAGPIEAAPERERGRRRQSSRAPSRGPGSRPVDVGDGFSYGAGPIEPERERRRSRRPSSSQLPIITDSGRRTFAPSSYAEPEWDDDVEFVPAPPRRRSRSRRR
ncbi:eCIS core domain-containing protein [Streptomyces sp. RKAG337]|uniref:eCIS core domain-containing protein n=1 Tax=Streptomyces sp. RKAG337 TaxID=2893404 RepID=UPI0020335987|nr:DUF4157 domain-containing protein [Streptomyces sp. RKAG337]MCM2425426.1 DUF4157 domain-containing protein [Streptomyces sp. RKAG337]